MERERTQTRRTRKTPLKALAGGLLAAILFAACQGDNLFVDFSLTDQLLDADIPTVDILDPSPLSVAAIPLGDSVLVTVDISDDAGVSRVVFEGLALRGDVNLGTDEVVERFVSKTVDFVPEVQDTTVSRYLQATPDSILETAVIIATVFDGAGNSSSDTVSLILGGPAVDIENLVGGEVIQSGLTLGLRVAARDGAGVREVEITITGVVTETITVQVSPVLDSVVVDTVVVIPAGLSGQMTITATATNSLDVVGQDGPITLTVTTASTSDDLPPDVQLDVTAPERLEFQDLISLSVTSVDNSQGSGIESTGYTVFGISPTRGDTVTMSDEVVFASPRTGTVIQTFDFTVFNFNELQLPDTMVYEVFGYAVDAQGNCSASVGEPRLVDYVCALQAGNRIAESRTGDRLTTVIVAGRTVLLPTGGRIADAVVDTIRGKLYMSNFDRDRVEIFELATETFQTAAAVGSQPWGMTMNRGEDTLLVANSGGVNISMVDLDPGGGGGTPVEDPARRLITPDVVLYDVEETRDEVSAIRYNVTFLPNATPPGFTDEPQYIAVDATGRILYSTVTEILGNFGTIRKAEVPAFGTDTEVKLFIQHAAMDENAAYTGVAHANRVFAVRGSGADEVTIEDHIPGNRAAFLTATGASAGETATAIQGLGSDAVSRPGRWSVENLGFHDTTYVSASGNGAWVVFGEGSVSPVGRVIMYEAATDQISGAIQVTDLMINGSETVRGIGLNNDGTLGVALGGQKASFFTTDLRLQGSADVTSGGAGAVLHPLHANAKSLQNLTGVDIPDTHMAFVGTGDKAIEIISTFHFLVTGRIFVKDLPAGPLRAVLPFPGDNAAFTCATRPVFDRVGANIGEAVEIFAGGNFNAPHPAAGGPTEDSCIVVKLIAITDVGGVVVLDVRKGDILRLHPSRSP